MFGGMMCRPVHSLAVLLQSTWLTRTTRIEDTAWSMEETMCRSQRAEYEHPGSSTGDNQRRGMLPVRSSCRCTRKVPGLGLVYLRTIGTRCFECSPTTLLLVIIWYQEKLFRLLYLLVHHYAWPSQDGECGVARREKSCDLVARRTSWRRLHAHAKHGPNRQRPCFMKSHPWLCHSFCFYLSFSFSLLRFFFFLAVRSCQRNRNGYGVPSSVVLFGVPRLLCYNGWE